MARGCCSGRLTRLFRERFRADHWCSRHLLRLFAGYRHGRRLHLGPSGTADARSEPARIVVRSAHLASQAPEFSAKAARPDSDSRARSRVGLLVAAAVGWTWEFASSPPWTTTPVDFYGGSDVAQLVPLKLFLRVTAGLLALRLLPSLAAVALSRRILEPARVRGSRCLRLRSSRCSPSSTGPRSLCRPTAS